MSLLTQQLRPVVSSRALKDNTDENVALQQTTHALLQAGIFSSSEGNEVRISPQPARGSNIASAGGARSSQTLRPGLPMK